MTNSAPATAIARNDLLAAVLYPDAADATDAVQMLYNLQSEVKQMQDQSGNVHQYYRDLLARQISDRVTTLGAGVNGAVCRIDTAYEIRGMVNLVTSYANVGGTGTPVNTVTLSYNPFEQLAAETQAPTGATSGYLYRTITYAYANGLSNTVQPTGVTYPYSTGSRTLGYVYNSGDDTHLCRVSALSFAGVNPLVSYTYFGLGSFASVAYNQPGVSSTLASGSSYTGFDRFGRVIDVPWTKTASGDLAQLKYGYNLASSRTYRNDVKSGGSFDELYGYDGLQRLLALNRGTLTSGDVAPITGLKLQQTWDLDATGNWSQFDNLDFGTPGNSLVQQRVSNTANEIAAISATVNTPWATPAYDRNGNMTSIPRPAAPTAVYPAAFDAWNRLVGLTGTATYGYDGLHRSTLSTASGYTRYFYYSDQWQVLEERKSTATSVPDRQYVWGIRYVDDLVLRDRGITGTLERFYAMQDANWNVAAIANASGAVKERYAFTAYGLCQFLNASFGSLTSSAYDWTVLYTGRALDDESGLYYYRMRYYHPLLGVFVSRDPIGDRTHLYDYTSCSPASFVDPFGEEELNCCCCCCAKDVVINDGGIQPRPGGTGKYYAVNVDIVTSWKKSKVYADCTLEWWEYSNYPSSGTHKGKPFLKNHWYDMYIDQHASATFAKWRDKDEVKECSASGTSKPPYTIKDVPSIKMAAPNYTWRLDFAIVIRSAEGCDCEEPTAHDAYARMTVTVKNSQLVEKQTKLVIGKWKPGQGPALPKGLPLK